MMNNRVIIPEKLRGPMLKFLHAAHQSTGKMGSRKLNSVFWPGMSTEVKLTRDKCTDCWRVTHTQPRTPSMMPLVPTCPFEAVCSDYFEIGGRSYLLVVDRFSAWPHIVTSASGSVGLNKALMNYFATFGIPKQLSSDGGPEFIAANTEDFLQRWGVDHHRVSSAYNPESNGRAEVGVKSMKRLLMSHLGSDGSIDTEAVAAGLLQYRNTPVESGGLSPSQIIFGRNLRDLLPVPPHTQVFDNEKVHPVWRDTWRCQEEALKLRFARQTENLNVHRRPLQPLLPGNLVLVQNQTGPHANKWNRTGVVVEAKPHEQYIVRMDGSGRVTLRNRRYLRRLEKLQGAQVPAPIGTGGADGQTPQLEVQVPMNNTHPCRPIAVFDEGDRGKPMQTQDQLVPEPGLHVETEQQRSEPLSPRKEAVHDISDTPAEPAAEVPVRTTQVSEEPSTGRPQRTRRPPKWYNPADY